MRWIEIRLIGSYSLLMKSWQFDLFKSKLETAKTISSPVKVSAISLRIKIHRPKLVSICGYKIETNGQNFMEIH